MGGALCPLNMRCPWCGWRILAEFFKRKECGGEV